MIFNQKKYRKAFSLIEISMVILVIGILIAGISNGIDLYKDMKLATAKNLTQNSRVGRIENLIAWFETTKESNFSKGTTAFENLKNFTANQEINRWKDNNPNSIVKYDATQTTSANQPKIIFDETTSLPVVKFDGSPRHFILPDGTVPFGNSAYSVIFVSKNIDNSSGGILGSGTYGTRNLTNAFRYESNKRIHNYWYGDDATDETTPANSVVTNKFQIFIFTYNQTDRKIYINGVYQTGDSPSARASTSINNTIGLTCSNCGGKEYLNGAIAELIIYDRALYTKEREDVEKYLAKKWSIKI
jgi:prepilin-type N-terminal cleavage/methylation domain-containing protein